MGELVIAVIEQMSSHLALLGGGAGAEGKAPSFLDALPDPMKLNPWEIGFVVLLITLLYLFLKASFFRPLIRVVDTREADIAAGASKKSEVSAVMEARQADYNAQLRELRGKAFEQRKALARAAAEQRQSLVDAAKARAAEQRALALEALKAQRESARTSLLSQVDALSDAMVQQLLKQA